MIRNLVVLASVVAATACTSGPDPEQVTRRDHAQSPANFVELTTRTETVAFEPGQAGLSGAALDSFRARLDPAVLGRGHLVVVAPPAPGDALSASRVEWTLAALRRAGVSAVPATAPRAAADGDGLILEIQQVAVAVPDCESYPRALNARVDEAASERLLGCATAANLGRMVADPLDLVRGRSLAPADSAPTVGAIEKYRTAGSKPESGNPIAEAFAKAFGGKDK